MRLHGAPRVDHARIAQIQIKRNSQPSRQTDARAATLLDAETRAIARGVDRDRTNPISALDIDARYIQSPRRR